MRTGHAYKLTQIRVKIRKTQKKKMVWNVKVLVAAEVHPTNAKSTAYVIRTIQDVESGETYAFPTNLQDIARHSQLAGLPPIISAKNAISKRGQYRTVKCALSPAIEKLYRDEYGNFIFETVMLEQVSAASMSFVDSGSACAATAPTAQEAMLQRKPLQSLTKEMVCQKFAGRAQNADIWLQIFVSECERVGVALADRIQAVRIFLEGSPLEWYMAMRKLEPTETSWENFSSIFLESFSSKGWTEVTYAYSYKHMYGSLSEYAIKKLGLLVDADPYLSEQSRVQMIVCGLPDNVKDKIKRGEVITQAKLLSELGRLESVAKGRARTGQGNDERNKDSKESSDRKGQQGYRNPKHKPCSICAKLGYHGRYHPESKCINNINSSNYKKSEKTDEKTIRVANNTVMEALLNEGVPDQKN